MNATAILWFSIGLLFGALVGLVERSLDRRRGDRRLFQDESE